MRGRSLFVRLMLIFLLLILPLQIIGLYSIKCSNAMLEETVEDLTYSNIEYLVNTLESHLSSIGSQMEDMLYSSASILKNCSRSGDEYSYWLKVREIMDNLITIRRRNDFANELFTFYPATGLRISTKWGVYDNAPQSTEDLFNAYIQSHAPYLIMDGKLYVCRSMYGGTEQDNVFLCAVISNSSLRELLESGVFNTYPAEICDTQGNPFVSVGMNCMPEQDIRYFHADGEAFSIVRYLPGSILRSKTKQSEQLLVLFIAACLPLFVVYCLLIRRYVKRPAEQLINAYHRVENGDLSFEIAKEATTYEFSELTDGFNSMLRKWKNSVDTVTKQQLLMQEMELKQLQSQINPHFLYNTFFLLSHMIEDNDAKSATPLLRNLGKYFRYITRTEKDIVSLRDEYEYGNIYLDIQKRRFEDNLQLYISPLPEEVRDIPVPKLILQPLFENVFTHARNTAYGAMELHCQIETDAKTVTVQVYDNGTGMTNEHLNKLRMAISDTASSMETTALINIAKRMRLAKMGQMFLEQTETGGLMVKLVFEK